MSVNILIFHLDDINIKELPQPEKYYHYIFIPRSVFNQNNGYALISLFWRKNNAKLMYTIGDPLEDWIKCMGNLPYQVRKRWIHLASIKDFDPAGIGYSLVGASRKEDQPLISVITTTFHSGTKLLRPWESLVAQTYNNWEWVIWDDSKDDTTWKQLEKLALTDLRLRIYRAPHCGFIGEMKRRSGSLCQGRWLVELDHDDRITPDLFQLIVDIDKKYPKAGFIYSDFFLLDEETERPHTFGNFAAFGFGWYFKQFLRDKFHCVYYTQSLNPVTISHIVGVPNHVRIWKRSIYEAAGRHCEDLSVADDYELLLQTFLQDCDWIRIPKTCYIQYNNAQGNNFTYIRNALIQHLTHQVWKIYGTRVLEKFNTLGYSPQVVPTKVNWMDTDPDYPGYEKIYSPCPLSILVIVRRNTASKALEATLTEIYSQKVPFLVYIVAHPGSIIEQVINRWIKVRSDTLNNLRYWNFKGANGKLHGPQDIWASEPTDHHLLNYGLKVGVHTDWVAYAVPGAMHWKKDHFDIINQQEVEWRLDKAGNLSSLIHRRDCYDKKGGYWKPAQTPQEMVDRWKEY